MVRRSIFDRSTVVDSQKNLFSLNSAPIADALNLSSLNMQRKIPNWVLLHFTLCLGLAG